MDKLEVSVPLTSNRTVDNQSYTTYLVHVASGEKEWTLGSILGPNRPQSRGTPRCCSCTTGYEVPEALTGSFQLRDKFPTKTLPAFPRKQIFHNPKDIEYRRATFEAYLQELLKDEDIRNSWELQYFLRVKTHVCLPYCA